MPYVPGRIKIPQLKGAEWGSLNCCSLDQAHHGSSQSFRKRPEARGLTQSLLSRTHPAPPADLSRCLLWIFHCPSCRKSWINSLFLHLYRDVFIFLKCVSQFLNYSGSWDRVFCHYYQWVNIMTASCFSVTIKENILNVALLSMGPVWFASSANFFLSSFFFLLR